MLIYNIGNSAIRANQAALQTVANNIANADTAGYHRQRATLTESLPLRQGSLMLGTGVKVQGITRVVDSAADRAITLNQSLLSRAQVQLESLQSIERLLNPNAGSLQAVVTQFFDDAERLAGAPTESSLQSAFIGTAQNVAHQITSLNQNLDHLQKETGSQIRETVSRINSLVQNISKIETQIKTVKATGATSPSLEDQRDLWVTELGSLVDLSPASLSQEDSPLIAAGGWLVVVEGAAPLTVKERIDGTFDVFVGNSTTPIQPVSGKLAGLLETSQQMVPATRAVLQEWTSVFLSGVNSVQATGLGLNGPTSRMTTFLGAVNTNVPLSASGSLLPLGPGGLTISVTNADTGEIETTTIAISPDSDSLQDIVTRLNNVPNFRANLSSTGQLILAAEPGYLFDFAGRPGSSIDTTGFSGTAVPHVLGNYYGSANASWTVTAVGSGQIGATAGLKLLVRDNATGQTVQELNVGPGYQVGQPIEIENGVFLTLSHGTLVAGDEFTLNAVSDPDSAGFLAAFGIGGLFQTTDLRNLQVNSDIVADPTRIAIGRTGNLSDTSQLNQLVILRDARILGNGTETLEGRLATITSNIGVDVNQQTSVVNQLKSQHQQLRDRQDSISGVDPNEELLSMLQFQRSFQANARYLSSVNSVLDDLLGLLR